MKNIKKNKWLIIPICILLLVIVSFVVFRFGTKPKEPIVQTIQYDQNLINKYDPTISKIDITKLKLGNSTLKDKQNSEEIKKELPITTIRASGGDFEIAGFSQKEGGDSFMSGGCGGKGIYKNYISYKNEYYTISLENLAYIFKPQSKEEFTNMINYFYALTPTFCGGEALIFDGSKQYDSHSNVDECNNKKINVGLEFINSKEKTFIYFFENSVYPMSLSKVTLKVDANYTLTKNAETVLTCNDGVQY
jgi:hypothetical protein